MITIGLIDNYAIIRLGLNFLLHEHFNELELLESDSVADFANQYEDKKCDVLVLGNNSLIARDCFKTVSALRKQFPQVPILVYDENINQNLTVRYFELRIQGYIAKESIAREIVNGINALLNKKQFLSPDVLESLLRFVVRKELEPAGANVLTARESEIALYLSQGMKTSWIAKTLDRKPSTISTIKHTIFKKMKVDNVVQLMNLFGLRDLEKAGR